MTVSYQPTPKEFFNDEHRNLISWLFQPKGCIFTENTIDLSRFAHGQKKIMKTHFTGYFFCKSDAIDKSNVYIEHNMSKYFDDIILSKYPLTETGKKFLSQLDPNRPLTAQHIIDSGPICDPRVLIQRLLHSCFYSNYEKILYTTVFAYCVYIDIDIFLQELLPFWKKNPYLVFRVFSVLSNDPSMMKYSVLEKAIASNIIYRSECTDVFEQLMIFGNDKAMYRKYYIKEAFKLKLCSFSIDEACEFGSTINDFMRSPDIFLCCCETDDDLKKFIRDEKNVIDQPIAILILENSTENDRSYYQQLLYKNNIIQLCIVLIQCGLPPITCESIVRFTLQSYRLRLIPFHFIYNIAAKIQNSWIKRKSVN